MINSDHLEVDRQILLTKYDTSLYVEVKLPFG